mmetsp:Transcript_24965/g.25180  ORF Transcript_24965/g.25180 Transcript_24965/m.25180 type:complete len:261 (+) Transcript_24965:120-902(+)
MRVLVGVKRVLDYAVKTRVSIDGTGTDLRNMKMSMNPFCEIAVEEAIRMKENKAIYDIIAVSIGPKGCQDTLRTALAMGADKAIHIFTDIRTDQNLQPLAVAKILSKIIIKENINLVLLGKQSIDGDNCQTGSMLAGRLGWSQGLFASNINIDPENHNVILTRETERGTETLSLPLPSVISTSLQLNTPRYATLPNIMRAKKKPIESVSLSDLDLSLADITPRNIIVNVKELNSRESEPAIILNSVDELIIRLKKDGIME